MAVVYIQKQPDMFTSDMYDAVNSHMGADTDPPEGLILHSLGQDDQGSWRMVDVWESREAADRFRDDRLMPALRAVMGEAGLDAGDIPDVEPLIYDTYDLSVGAGARSA
jgi:quinol monooxygenase YgiN